MAIHEINLHYLPIPKRLHYLVAHVYFRTKVGGCYESIKDIASKFEADGLSESTIEKDLRQCIGLGVIEVENPGLPGRKLRTTQKVHSFLEENTQSIMDRESAKKVFQDRKNLRTYPVKDYGQDRKELLENTVKNYGHNRNRKETSKINSLNGEREDFEKIKIEASGGPEFIKAIQENGLMEKIREIISEAGPDPEKDTPSILRHFGGLDNNRGKSFTPDEISQRLKGYFKNGLHLNGGNGIKETHPVKPKAGRMI